MYKLYSFDFLKNEEIYSPLIKLFSLLFSFFILEFILSKKKIQHKIKIPFENKKKKNKDIRKLIFEMKKKNPF